jgi:hypothetical protein
MASSPTETRTGNPRIKKYLAILTDDLARARTRIAKAIVPRQASVEQRPRARRQSS